MSPTHRLSPQAVISPPGSCNCWHAEPPKWPGWCGRSWSKASAIASRWSGRRYNHRRESRRSGGWEGRTDTNARSGRTGKWDTPLVPEHLGMRLNGWDPFAEGIMASGHEHRSNRSNTWPHRPALQKRQTNPLPTGGRSLIAGLESSANSSGTFASPRTTVLSAAGPGRRIIGFNSTSLPRSPA
jgi:hypothetical protein